MSSESMLWVNTDTINSSGNAHLLHLTREGACFAFGEPARIKAWSERIRNGEAAEIVTQPFVRIPWSSFEWFEWSDDVELRFSYQVPGHGAIAYTFEANDNMERAEVADALRSLGVFQASARKKTPFEIVKSPLIALVSTLFVMGVLFWGVGQHGGGGASRASARMALVTSVANFLGYGGIGAITFVAVLGVGAYVGMRLRNPPTVYRLTSTTA